MYPVSARFLQAITESHRSVVQAVLYRTDGSVETLEITGGSVPVDRKAAVRRTCTVTLDDPALIPRTEADKVSVYGARLRITVGIQYQDGAQELVPVGLFRVDEVSGDIDEGPATITGKSLEAVVSDDRFTEPYRATGTAVSAITALIQRSIPGATLISTSVVDAAIGARTWDTGGDPWAAITEIAQVVGAEVYADPDGVFVLEELPDVLAAVPVWTVRTGEGGAYIQADRGMSSAGVHNGVMARGENTEAGTVPVAALVVDSDPGSPTYWGGPFGHRPDPNVVSSPMLVTEVQCVAAATLRLRAARAANASADLSALPNPALAPGDVLRVVYEDGTAELHQVSSFTVPLEAGGDFSIRTIAAREDT